MRIMDYQVNQSGSSKYEEKSQITEIVRVGETQVGAKPNITSKAFQLDIEPNELKNKPVQSEKPNEENPIMDKKMAVIRLLESMLSKLRGKDVKLDTSFLNVEMGDAKGAHDKASMEVRSFRRGQNNRTNTMSIEYTHREIYEKKEGVNF